MTYLLIPVAILLVFISFQYITIRKSKKNVGNPVRLDLLSQELKAKVDGEKAFLYFFAPSCSACRHQTPIIENLKKEFSFIFEIDASKSTIDAKAFGVLGTPTCILLNNNKIKDVFVGVKSEPFLRNKLNSVD